MVPSLVMSRMHRLAALVALCLVFIAGGTVLATRGPDASDPPAPQAQDGEETPPTAEELAHALERLGNVVTEDVFAELATEYGVGGAVRIVAWSEGNADRIAEIRDMRDGDGSEDAGMGWGQIAKDLGVHPGIGSIMGQGGGHGRENAPGQQDDDTGN